MRKIVKKINRCHSLEVMKPARLLQQNDLVNKMPEIMAYEQSNYSFGSAADDSNEEIVSIAPGEILHCHDIIMSAGTSLDDWLNDY